MSSVLDDGVLLVYGRSDDLVRVEGEALDEEFYVPYPEDKVVLTFSDGTVLDVAYGRSGAWSVSIVARGYAVEARNPPDNDAPHYSDAVQLDANAVEWVAVADEFRRVGDGA